ncbi:MAG: peptidase M14, partial [bacterium]
MKTSRLLSIFLFLPAFIFAQNLPTPEDHFGHRMGAEGQIISFFDGIKYYKKLAEKSDRILYTELGKTTDGSPFVLLVISAPENLQRLDELKRERHRLSDPRNISDS